MKEIWKKIRKENKDVKEEFCGLCMAVPLAFAGVGASAYGTSSSRGKHKSKKKIALYVGIIAIIISLIIAAYYWFSCKKCR
jgi:Na+-driven multidrug efflux pump